MANFIQNFKPSLEMRIKTLRSALEIYESLESCCGSCEYCQGFDIGQGHIDFICSYIGNEIDINNVYCTNYKRSREHDKRVKEIEEELIRILKWEF